MDDKLVIVKDGAKYTYKLDRVTRVVYTGVESTTGALGEDVVIPRQDYCDSHGSLEAEMAKMPSGWVKKDGEWKWVGDPVSEPTVAIGDNVPAAPAKLSRKKAIKKIRKIFDKFDATGEEYSSADLMNDICNILVHTR